AIRWLADKRRERDKAFSMLSATEKSAESDRGKGVLLSSGYIAGGALAGIVIAFSAGLVTEFDSVVGVWAARHNCFFAGRYANELSLLPYFSLLLFLCFIDRKNKN
ncbi:MAG TPA: hypothetical protein VFM32_11585, partial [Spongiibacteraceae bacterium]|nr:hypothetical protein [Spongiibacteraceae bacterium]